MISQFWIAVLAGITLIGVIVFSVRSHGLRLPPASLLSCLAIAYIVTALLFSSGYMMLYEHDNRSIAGLSDPPSNYDFVYLSFETITTLGFGDVRPVTPVARLMAISEAVVGVFYIAILIGNMWPGVGDRIHVEQRVVKR
jgi:hypothetical protein